MNLGAMSKDEYDAWLEFFAASKVTAYGGTPSVLRLVFGHARDAGIKLPDLRPYSGWARRGTTSSTRTSRRRAQRAAMGHVRQHGDMDRSPGQGEHGQEVLLQWLRGHGDSRHPDLHRPSSEISTIETPYRKDHFDTEIRRQLRDSRRHGSRPCRARRLRTHAVELPDTVDPPARQSIVDIVSTMRPGPPR